MKIYKPKKDLFGKTGRNLNAKLVKIDTELKIEHVQQCAAGNLKRKVSELFLAITIRRMVVVD